MEKKVGGGFTPSNACLAHQAARERDDYVAALYYWAQMAADEHRTFMTELHDELHKELRWQHWQGVVMDAALLIVSLAAVWIALKH